MKCRVKNILFGATCFMLGSALTVSAGTWISAYRNDEITVTLDGMVQEFRDETTNEIQYPLTYEGRTYLPLRTVANLTGLNVNYDDVTKTAKLESRKYIDNNDKVTVSNLGDGMEYDITGINIISKIYDNATVSVDVANIYENHDENSKIVGKLEKGSFITVQNYDNGWSTVTNYTYSGWMKTENIKLPDISDRFESESYGMVK